MTQYYWKLILPFVQAGAEGKRIEVNYGDKMYWRELQGDALLSTYPSLIRIGAVRIAPEPTFVQWTDDEVPLDAWYRRILKPNEWFKIKSRFFHEGHNRIRYEMTNPIDLSPDVKSLSLDYEHSTDGGKTWNAAGRRSPNENQSHIK